MMRTMMCLVAVMVGLASFAPGCSRIRERRAEERSSGDEKGIVIKDDLGDDDRGHDEHDRDRDREHDEHATTTTTTTVHAD